VPAVKTDQLPLTNTGSGVGIEVAVFLPFSDHQKEPNSFAAILVGFDKTNSCSSSRVISLS
jgi:hypothetical protein